VTDQDPATLCPGCFEAPAGTGPCRVCGFDAREPRPPGATGITDLAFDRHLQARVAIKEYLPLDWAMRTADGRGIRPYAGDEADWFRDGLARFLREARVLARIDHPNVVRVRHFFEANGSAYLVMVHRGLCPAGAVRAQGRPGPGP
jgi:hypothetical protein